MLATSLLAGALGAGIGAGAVIATDDDTTTSSTTTAGEVGGVSTTTLPDGSVARVADTVLPSVVSIQFTGAQGGGSGSGIVIDESGLILTNNHVVEGAADGGSLSVAFQDGTSTSAEIVGRDPSADIAVIRVDGVDNLAAGQARLLRRPPGRRDGGGHRLTARAQRHRHDRNRQRQEPPSPAG